MIDTIHNNYFYLNLDTIFCNDANKHMHVKSYAHNEIIYKKGQVPKHLFIFLSGQIKEQGTKVAKVNSYTYGQIIGAYANFANICYLETILFFSPGAMLVIEFDYFEQQIKKHTILLEQIINILHKKQHIIAKFDAIFIQMN